MQETLSTQENTQEIADTKKNNETKNTAIEEALMQKLPGNKEKQDFFLNIFQQPKISDFFSQEDITSYIKENPIWSQYRILKSKTLEEQTTAVREDMDTFIKNKTGTFKEIIATNNNLSNQVEQTNQWAEKTKDINEQAKKTKESYDKLDSKYKVTDEQVQTAKTEGTISQSTIDQITKKTQGTELNVDDYLKFYLTAETNKDELKGSEFMQNYEALNDKLGIMPPMTTMKKVLDNPEHTDVIVENNESLNKYTQTSDKFDKISKPILPESKDFDEEFATYVKLIPDERLRNEIENNKDIIKSYKEIHDKDDEIAKSMKGAEMYDTYIHAVDDVKEHLPERTQQIIKQRVMGSCIRGLASYFDNNKIDEKNFANILETDTQKGFSIQKGTDQNETNDDILAINETINGNTIGFYYNLNNPDAQLQSDDFLHYDITSETFAFGANKWGKNKLGVKLPTLNMLTIQAQTVSEKYFNELLESSQDQESFETALKDKISEELMKNYGQEALIKNRVERDVQKNITAQTLQKTFVPETVMLELNRDSKTEKITEKKARKLMEIRDKSTENMRSDENNICENLIKRLDPLLKKDHRNHLEPRRQKMLKAINQERRAVDYSSQRGKSTLKFFNRFSKNGKISLNDLNTFVDNIEKDESVSENINRYSADFQTIEDHEEADNMLDNL